MQNLRLCPRYDNIKISEILSFRNHPTCRHGTVDDSAVDTTIRNGRHRAVERLHLFVQAQVSSSSIEPPHMRFRTSRSLACWAPVLFQPRQLLLGEVEVWRAALNQRPSLVDALSSAERTRAHAMGDAQVSPCRGMAGE